VSPVPTRWTDLHAEVITLDCNRERWNRIATDLEAAGLPARRLSAVDGRNRSAESFESYGDAEARRMMARPLLGAELGCYLSHLRFLESFLSSGRRFGLVLEDDAHIPADAADRLRRVLAVLSDATHWDVMNCCAAPRRFSRVIGPDRAAGVSRAYHFPMRTTAVLWSREGAQRFLDDHQGIVRPIDLDLRAFVGASGRGLALRRPLFPPHSLVSTIGGVHDLRAVKSRTPGYRMRIMGRHLRENLSAMIAWSTARDGQNDARTS
jgi:glycosyl transferase family 25